MYKKKHRIIHKVYCMLKEREWEVNLTQYKVVDSDIVEDCLDSQYTKVNKKARRLGLIHRAKPRIK